MTSDHDTLWRRCAHLGRLLLPVVDEEQWRRARRHERLGTWGIGIAEGERLIEVFGALAAHAVAVDTSVSAAELDVLPLRAVADAATGKRDFELLAGLPDTFADGRDELAVKVLRLYTYRDGLFSRRLVQVSAEVRRALNVLAERSRMPSPRCGHVFFWAAAAGLSSGHGDVTK
ncbi:hypothetical protein [Streptomyces sp. NBC_00199]|uniref:hypothetical protein n=1 Tax=Streptomyces sp. NBC_00199 TaxID=2975678 RepID=UPI002250F57F|nr:hypothetical protein [Streptomyces sp. NBC_00199]MCX5264955.1 hypothetical protein [Streptomyces sp. NBC_00199]